MVHILSYSVIRILHTELFAHVSLLQSEAVHVIHFFSGAHSDSSDDLRRVFGTWSMAEGIYHKVL